MPEYLAPGVYVEEVSFRSKSIEGVPTSTTGFVGMAAWGPVFYAGGPRSTAPRLVTSFAEFERVYGGLLPLSFDGIERENYLAHAARAYFANGGKRLYVSRVFSAGSGLAASCCASASIDRTDGGRGALRARWPGAAGNCAIEIAVVRKGQQAQRAAKGAVVEIADAPRRGNSLARDQLYVVDVDGQGARHFRRDGKEHALDATQTVQVIELRVSVFFSPERTDVYNDLALHKDQTRDVLRVLHRDEPEDENALIYLDWTREAGNPDEAIDLLLALAAPAARPEPIKAGSRSEELPTTRATERSTDSIQPRRIVLSGGSDGAIASPVGREGLEGDKADPDNATIPATGLAALGEIDDIAIVAAPDAGAYSDVTLTAAAADVLIGHAEQLRYRIAVVDAPRHCSINQIRQFRARFDSKYAALYHPWIEILDPMQRASQGAPPRRIALPPSGFVTGIYARTDVERGVHKAPANEVVRGLTALEANINHGRQEVLNPEGINALRFFEGRGTRVWGARTLSSDPEWKYVNVRRLFIYLEHSIDKSTQWAVFEPNNERLWRNIRSTVEDFLLVLWRDGALLGSKPEESFFVRCDRTTMLQNDLDNGRLICLIGIAPVKPAEFVIFRVGQWTADSKKN